nr:hypothetical protein [Tissierella sp.]
MFSNAKEQKEKTINNAISNIQKLINEAVEKGLNRITFDSDEYYMGEEVEEGLKNAGYKIDKREQDLIIYSSSTYTISW